MACPRKIGIASVRDLAHLQCDLTSFVNLQALLSRLSAVSAPTFSGDGNHNEQDRCDDPNAQAVTREAEEDWFKTTTLRLSHRMIAWGNKSLVAELTVKLRVRLSI